jgi:hypothetical protein
MDAESFKAQSRPGDNTGVGTVLWEVSGSLGNKTYGPQRIWQDSRSICERVFRQLPATTAPAAGAYPLFVVREGIWVVDYVHIFQQTNGTSITFDVLWAPSGTAGGSGTTQLTGTISGGSAGNNNKIVLGTLITTPTQAGPGNVLHVNVGGTVTGFIGFVEVAIGRVL